MSLIGNIRARGFKDILSPTKWGVFARYLKRRALKQEYPELSVPGYVEQIAVRMKKCPDCTESPTCVHCTCKSPELFYDKDNYCSEERWKEMIPPEEWEEYKKTNGININPKHIKQILKHGVIKWDR